MRRYKIAEKIISFEIVKYNYFNLGQDGLPGMPDKFNTYYYLISHSFEKKKKSSFQF